jgi:hypothetical protein
MPSVTGLIPEIWSASILREYTKAAVFTHCMGRLYQGEIKVGNVVKVPRVGSVSVRPYVLRTPITYDDVDSDTIDITIDQQTYFGLRCEDVERVQAMPDFLDAACRNAALSMKDHIDTYTAGILNAGAGTTLGATTPIASTDYLHLFSLIGQKLDEKNVPRSGRWIVIPPFMASAIAEKIMNLQTPNQAVVADAWITRAFGFDIYCSNNLPVTAGKYSIFAGNSDCGVHLVQINETEKIRDPEQFGDLVRGLCVYTSKVLLPDALVKAVVQPPTESIT